MNTVTQETINYLNVESKTKAPPTLCLNSVLRAFSPIYALIVDCYPTLIYLFFDKFTRERVKNKSIELKCNIHTFLPWRRYFSSRKFASADCENKSSFFANNKKFLFASKIDAFMSSCKNNKSGPREDIKDYSEGDFHEKCKPHVLNNLQTTNRSCVGLITSGRKHRLSLVIIVLSAAIIRLIAHNKFNQLK